VHLLDASAIAMLLKKKREKAAELLKNEHTTNLAGYELGNIIWKEHALRNAISLQEAVDKAKHIAKLLKIMKILKIETDEDYAKAIELASKHRLTFYDAAYAYLAEKHKLTLVTEDTELREKANTANIKAIPTDKFIQNRKQQPLRS